MALPNLRCETCKWRRIKCDGREPVCLKCARSQRACQRNTNVQDPNIIHNENAYASGHYKRPRGPRTVATVDATKERSNLSPNPSIDLETVALNSYYYSYLRHTNSPSDIVRVMSDGLLSLWTSNPAFELVRLSTTVVALALFSATQHHAQAAMEASRKYGHLLRKTRESLASPSEQNINACLVAATLMGRYEDIVFPPHSSARKKRFMDTLQSSLHHDGALELLKTWKIYSAYNPTTSTDVVKLARRGVIKFALMRNCVLPESILHGEDFGEQGIALEYDRFFIRIALARSRLESIRLNKSQNVEQMCTDAANSVAYEAQDINLALEGFWTRLSSPKDLQTLLDDDNCSSSDSTLPSIDENFSSAIFRNTILAMRMLAISTHIEALELYSICAQSSVDDPSPIQEARSGISVVAQALICSLHGSLRKHTASISVNDIDRMSGMDQNTSLFQLDRLVWPLTIASAVKEVDEFQNQWFKAHLANIGDILGVGVLQDAKSKEWIWF